MTKQNCCDKAKRANTIKKNGTLVFKTRRQSLSEYVPVWTWFSKSCDVIFCYSNRVCTSLSSFIWRNEYFKESWIMCTQTVITFAHVTLLERGVRCLREPKTEMLYLFARTYGFIIHCSDGEIQCCFHDRLNRCLYNFHGKFDLEIGQPRGKVWKRWDLKKWALIEQNDERCFFVRLCGENVAKIIPGD